MKNNFHAFYKSTLEVGRLLNNNSVSLSAAEFRDLQTIFAFDISSIPVTDVPGVLTIKIEISLLLSDETDETGETGKYVK